jgi:purine-binding chemotaxis protein CheW
MQASSQNRLSVSNDITAASAANQYLTFIMANEEYGVDILCVQEIRGWESATPLPNAPKHIKGVINLRGTIVPIIDLRQCFGLPAIDYTPITVVIVLKVQHQDSSRIIGIVVDGVSDVYALAEGEMRQAPDLGHAVDTHFIKGLVSIDKKMVILLNIDQLLDIEDLPNLSGLHDQLAKS